MWFDGASACEMFITRGIPSFYGLSKSIYSFQSLLVVAETLL